MVLIQLQYKSEKDKCQQLDEKKECKEKETKEKKRKKRVGKTRKVYDTKKIMLEIQDLIRDPDDSFKALQKKEFKLKALEKLAIISLKYEQNKLLGNSDKETIKEIKLSFVDGKNSSNGEDRISKLDEEIKRGIDDGH